MICMHCKAYDHVIIEDATLLSSKGFRLAMSDLVACRDAIEFQRNDRQDDLWKAERTLRELRNS